MIARYTRPELARLWSDDHRYDIWLRIELAACEAMEAAGSVPRGTAAAVRAKAAGKLNAARILENEERTRHDVIAFLTHVEELAGEPARWLHLGMTSSDVLDTALALQLGRGDRSDPRGRSTSCAPPAAAAPTSTRATPVIGRSHGIHAEPITAGLVFARLLRRGRARAARAGRGARTRSRSARSPARSASTPTSTRRSRPRALATLGLRPEVVPTQIVARDRHAALLRGARAARHGDRAHRARPCATGSAPRSARRRRPSARARRARRRCRTRRTRSCRENLCGLARLLRGVRAGRPSRTSRCGTSATSRTRRVERVIGARRDGPRRLHGPRAPPASSTASSSTRERMRAQPRSAPAACSSARRCCWRWCARAWRARRRTSWCSATRCASRGAAGRAGRSGQSFRALLGDDPDVAAQARRRRDRPGLRPRSPPALTPARSSIARSAAD